MLSQHPETARERLRERETQTKAGWKQRKMGREGGKVHAAMTGFVTSLSAGSAERGTLGNYQIRMH